MEQIAEVKPNTPQTFLDKKASVVNSLQEQIKKKAAEEFDKDEVKELLLDKPQEKPEGEIVDKPVEGVDKEEKPKMGDDDFTSRMAQLARREQKTLEREKALKEKESILLEHERTLAKAKENPLEALKMIGWEFEQLIEAGLNDFKPPEKKQQDQMLELLQQIQERLDKVEKKPEEEISKLRQEAIEASKNTFKKELFNYIDNNKEKYKYVAELGAHETAYAVAEAAYEADGTQLSFEEALEKTENWLKSEVAKSKQVLLRLEGNEPSNTPNSNTKAQLAPKTISSAMSDTGTTGFNMSSGSWEEKKAKAARLLEKMRSSKT